MPTLADLIAAKTRTPSATVYLNGQRWYGIISLSASQAFGSGIATGQVIGRAPPVEPQIGMAISWTWGYNGVEVAGFTGEIARPARKSYPNRYTLDCRDVLWRADRVQQVIQTSPLNNIAAKAAIEYILTHYGGISAARLAIPDLQASGSGWVGSSWVLGTLTPVEWGDPDTNSGGTTALRACQDICSCLGYWLYATPAGNITAKQLERRPSSSALRTYRRGVDLLVQGSPEVSSDVDQIKNRIIVRGANTGVEGAQISDTWQTDHPLLPKGVYVDDTFSSPLIEYVNESEAGAASATAIAKRILQVKSRVPSIEKHRAKADPRVLVGATVGVQDSAVGLSTARNYFVYSVERKLDAVKGAFDDQLTLDGGVGSQGYTTVPPPDAAFSWRLVTEKLDSGDSVVEVFLDGSASASLSGGAIVSWAWSTSATVYSGTPSSASGPTAVLVFPNTPTPVNITLTVTDTTSKTGTITQAVPLDAAVGAPTIARALAVAFGAAWAITPDGGATWNTETSAGDAIAVGIIGAGVDSRSPAGSAATYGALATRGSGGTGLRGTADNLATASTALVSAGGAITSNIWVNEANPARVWFAVGTAVYRSTDGGVTKVAMAAAPATVHWIMEDPALDNSVFIAAGANFYVTTDPTAGWVLYYAGPTGATARQFVRSRDGQVTWIAYTGTFTGSPLQRIENGAGVTFPGGTTEIRALALDRNASSAAATVYAIDSQNPAKIFSADGLTGLGVTTLSSALPSGATAQHMLADPDVDLIYVADFDSVAVGTGAVRKLLPSADRLLLYKAGASGQQAHMLGLIGAVRALTGTIYMLPYGESGAADALFILDLSTRTWSSKALPESGRSDWYSIKASPFDPNKLLLFRRDEAVDDVNRLWYSTDAGDTWTSVFQNLAQDTGFNAMPDVQWSPTFGDQWCVVFSNQIVRGTGSSYTQHPITSSGTKFSGGAGAAGDVVFVGISGEFYVLPAGGSETSINPSSGIGFGYPSLLSTGRQLAWARESGELPIAVSSDYAAGTFTALSAHARRTLALLADGTIIGHLGDAVETVTTPFTSPSVTSLTLLTGLDVTAVVADQQTRTLAAAIVQGSYTSGMSGSVIYVRDTAGGWTRFERPAAAGNLANAIEIVVRSS